ncbi:esterase/lipase superfamily enzyme [Bradyrhizobium sp. USDA 4524]|uniref:alpha/beta hydrolase n=1 Tax=unclassified Bradyrhizobium TaxID=2631580 RepID=UPI00209CFC7B|nr:MULTISPECIES: alpha/beta hydrolase [unclassified Bradyrhizobium]MCP1846056.1 esterase/lipase superfamily enzyme [Bradyrhizobium sp. USDA 4538]MCP1907310.1 esterase/lipase superfamily enzyme [Bradyrhizobium sp. USDA 4537]MCP1985786.1 esterase/lipase superfamily enzyme [Bradyrhizobium sp. USDA 4539]
MRRFGKPTKPFYIIVSKDDKALGVSNFLAGGQTRLGADANTAELAELGATVIDMTDVKALDSTNHDKFAQLAAVAPQLEAVLEQGIGPQRRDASAPEIAGNSLEAIVKLPIALISAPRAAVAGN